jgi:hypothetical protein
MHSEAFGLQATPAHWIERGLSRQVRLIVRNSRAFALLGHSSEFWPTKAIAYFIEVNFMVRFMYSPNSRKPI